MKVINIKSKESYDLYVGRKNSHYGLPESKWHNPFRLEDHNNDRQKVCDLYESYIRNGPLWNELEELDGLVLACWCMPKLCHGSILIKLLNEKKLSKIFE